MSTTKITLDLNNPGHLNWSHLKVIECKCLGLFFFCMIFTFSRFFQAYWPDSVYLWVRFPIWFSKSWELLKWHLTFQSLKVILGWLSANVVYLARFSFLARLSQRENWAFQITWHLSSVHACVRSCVHASVCACVRLWHHFSPKCFGSFIDIWCQNTFRHSPGRSLSDFGFAHLKFF